MEWEKISKSTKKCHQNIFFCRDYFCHKNRDIAQNFKRNYGDILEKHRAIQMKKFRKMKNSSQKKENTQIQRSANSK